jgi:hypothetical protein
VSILTFKKCFPVVVALSINVMFPHGISLGIDSTGLVYDTNVCSPVLSLWLIWL